MLSTETKNVIDNLKQACSYAKYIDDLSREGNDFAYLLSFFVYHSKILSQKIKEITVSELYHLNKMFYEYYKIIDFDALNTLSSDTYESGFLLFLKHRCDEDALRSLVKLGAKQEDCYINFFDDLAKNNKKVKSLQTIITEYIDKQKVEFDTLVLNRKLSADILTEIVATGIRLRRTQDLASNGFNCLRNLYGYLPSYKTFNANKKAPEVTIEQLDKNVRAGLFG